MSFRKIFLPVVVLSLCVSMFAHKKQKDERTAALSFTILKDYNGRPIRNAAVILHAVNDKGDQANGGLELKTDNDGRCGIDSIPYGKMRIQVIVPGFQTYGEDLEISQPKQSFTITMQQPHGQYSIYTGGIASASPSATATPSPQ